MSPRPDGASPSLLARLFDVLCFYPLPLPPPGEPFCRGGIRTQAPGEKGEGRMSPPRNSGPWGNVCRVVLRVSLPCPPPSPTVFWAPFCSEPLPYFGIPPKSRWPILRDLECFLSGPLRNTLSPGDHLVLLSCQAGKHPYTRGRLGARNPDKLLSNKVLLMAGSLLCQRSLKFLHSCSSWSLVMVGKRHSK